MTSKDLQPESIEGLDDLIREFKSYCTGGAGLDELDFKEAILDAFKIREERIERETYEEIRYAIMRGEYGHDEVSIVKELESRAAELKHEGDK